MSATPPGSQDRPWGAERVVDAAAARALIRQAVPDLSVDQLEPFGTGWDNTAWLVDRRWVFRFPRREIAVELLRAEARVLPIIAPHLPLPVPLPRHLGEPTEPFPWPFAGYPLLPGVTACRARLDETARAALAVPLGRFLGALHALPAEILREAKAPPDTLGRLALPRRAEAAAGRLEQVARAGLLTDTSPWLELLARMPARWRPRRDHLVHGDLYARHLLVDDSGAAAGVIDWGDVHLGEPALDLSIAYGFLPPDARRDFFDAYAGSGVPLGPEHHQMARFKALYTALTLLAYGHDIGDDDLLREGRRGLRFLSQDAGSA